MERILKLRYVTLVSLLAVAAFLVLQGRGADPAEAIDTFTIDYDVALSDSSAGANATITEFFTIGATDAFFDDDRVVLSTPADPGGVTGWATPDYASVAIGAVVGSSISASTIGIANSPCSQIAPVPFDPLVNAVTDVTGPNDGDPDGPAADAWDGFKDLNADGLADSVTEYPFFLEGVLPQNSSTSTHPSVSTGDPDTGGPPLARLSGRVLNFAGQVGTHVALELLIYSPGQLEDLFGILAADGYPMVIVLENPDDNRPSTPSTITDVCAPLTTFITRAGRSSDNPASPAAEPVVDIWTNPSSASTQTFTADLTSIPDADHDGLDNSLDTCPFIANLENPRLGGDAGDPDGDGIDSACDNTSIFTPAPKTLNPLPWSATSPCRFGAGDDGLEETCDAEVLVIGGFGFLNRDDKCPMHFDVTDADSDGDGIGDVCDIGAGAEDDSANACSAVLIGPASNPGPFDLFTAECGTADACTGVGAGIDDDGDLVIDDGCAGGPSAAGGSPDVVDGSPINVRPTATVSILELHDISIVGLKGASKTKSGETHGYSVRLRNDSPEDETIPVLIAAAAVSGCAKPGLDWTGAEGGGPDGIPDDFTPDADITADFPIVVEDAVEVIFPPVNNFIGTDVTLKAGKQKQGIDFNVIYGDCPLAATGPEDKTPTDYIVVVDVCHSGDGDPLGFFSAGDCPTFQAPDGGLDTNFGNDSRTTLLINNTEFFKIP